MVQAGEFQKLLIEYDLNIKLITTNSLELPSNYKYHLTNLRNGSTPGRLDGIRPHSLDSDLLC